VGLKRRRPDLIELPSVDVRIRTPSLLTRRRASSQASDILTRHRLDRAGEFRPKVLSAIAHGNASADAGSPPGARREAYLDFGPLFTIGGLLLGFSLLPPRFDIVCRLLCHRSDGPASCHPYRQSRLICPMVASARA
jgi:hypothetical protein